MVRCSTGVMSSVHEKVLTLETPPPEPVPTPQNVPRVHAAAAPSSSLPAGPLPPSVNGGDSHMTSDPWRSPASTANMRRYDSHSLLSENSIASSRFDITEGASYPE